MTPTEATSVLGLLTAAWPSAQVTRPTMVLWMNQLEGVRIETGMEAAGVIIRGDQWFPTLNRFLETCQAVARRHALAESTALALERAPITDEGRTIARRNLDESRRLLIAAGAKGVRAVDRTTGDEPLAET